jgi:hypothetical protein
VFPSRPVFHDIPASVGDTRYTMHIAVGQIDTAVATSAEVVEEAQISPGLPPSSFDANLRAVIGTFAGSNSRAALTSETSTTFQGEAAREGQFSITDGLPLTVLAFMDGPNRLYVLSAPAGALFDALAASLVLLP